MSSFVPDGILVVESQETRNLKGKVVLLEFAGGMSEQASDMEVMAQHKKNNYSNALVFL